MVTSQADRCRPSRPRGRAGRQRRRAGRCRRTASGLADSNRRRPSVACTACPRIPTGAPRREYRLRSGRWRETATPSSIPQSGPTPGGQRHGDQNAEGEDQPPRSGATRESFHGRGPEHPSRSQLRWHGHDNPPAGDEWNRQEEGRRKQRHRWCVGQAFRHPVQRDGSDQGETEADGGRQHQSRAANTARGGDQKLERGSSGRVGGEPVDHHGTEQARPRTCRRAAGSHRVRQDAAAGDWIEDRDRQRRHCRWRASPFARARASGPDDVPASVS